MIETAVEVGGSGDGPAADRDLTSPTLLTVPAVFSRVTRIWMTLFPARL
jgi:hypothetical protein